MSEACSKYIEQEILKSIMTCGEIEIQKDTKCTRFYVRSSTSQDISNIEENSILSEN